MRSAASSRASRGEIQDHSGSTESAKGNLTNDMCWKRLANRSQANNQEGLVDSIGFAILSSKL